MNVCCNKSIIRLQTCNNFLILYVKSAIKRTKVSLFGQDWILVYKAFEEENIWSKTNISCIYQYYNVKNIWTISVDRVLSLGSLAQEDFPACAEVLTRLCGTFVGTSLEADDGLSSFQLFFGEVALALVGWLGAQVWAGPLAGAVSLSAEGEQRCCHLGYVFLLVQIHRLEEVYVWDPVCGQRLEEAATRDPTLVISLMTSFAKDAR